MQNDSPKKSNRSSSRSQIYSSMKSFTDLPESVVGDIFCDWGDVRTLAKIDTAFCSHNDNVRTWMLYIFSKLVCFVPDTVAFTSDFISWVLVKQINLKDLRIVNKLFDHGELKDSFKLTGVEYLTFELCNKSRNSRKRDAMEQQGYIEYLVKCVTDYIEKGSDMYQISQAKINSELGEDVEHNGLVTVINGCLMLKELCIDQFPAFNDSQLSLVSTSILSQLVSLELHHETSDLRLTFDVLSSHCNNLNTLSLSGAKMCIKGVSKLIANNSRLKYLNVDCPLVCVNDICDALSTAGNEPIVGITVKRCKIYGTENVIPGTRLLQHYKDQCLKFLDIQNVFSYNCDEDSNGAKNIHIRVTVDYGTRHYDVLFNALPVVNTVYIDNKDEFCLKVGPHELVQLVTQYYYNTLTTVILLDSSYMPLFFADVVEYMIGSCKHIKHLVLASTLRLSCQCIQRLCLWSPELCHIEFIDLERVTSTAVIAILNSTKYNVSKVTATLCPQVKQDEVNEAILRLNAKKNKTKSVEFVSNSCGHRD